MWPHLRQLTPRSRGRGLAKYVPPGGPFPQCLGLVTAPAPAQTDAPHHAPARGGTPRSWGKCPYRPEIPRLDGLQRVDSLLREPGHIVQGLVDILWVQTGIDRKSTRLN